MCIRDSVGTEGQVFAFEPVPDIAAQLVTNAGLNGFTNITAVSYTHLRAHETVLDIVCRLLLEKQTLNTRTYQLPPILQSILPHSTLTTIILLHQHYLTPTT